MARASAGVTPAWAWAPVKRSVGSRAIQPVKALRVTVFMVSPISVVSYSQCFGRANIVLSAIRQHEPGASSAEDFNLEKARDRWLQDIGQLFGQTYGRPLLRI